MVFLLAKRLRQTFYLAAGMVEEFLIPAHSSEICFWLVCSPHELLRRLWEAAVAQSVPCKLCCLRALLGAEYYCGGFSWLMLTTRGQVLKKKSITAHCKYS